MIRIGHFLARQGSWVEDMHEIVMTEDEPLYGLACRFDEKAECVEKEWRFVMNDTDWFYFCQEANGILGILEREK